MSQSQHSRNYSEYTTHPDNTIEEAWTKIEENRKRSLIVVEDGRVVGTVSDGDIRKAILSRRLITTPIREIMNTNFISVHEQQRDKGQELMRQKDVFLIPVVDSEMNFVDLIIR